MESRARSEGSGAGRAAGKKLDAEAAAFLERLASSPLPAVHLGTPEEARARHEEASRALREPVEAVAAVRPVEAGGVAARLFVPAAPRGTTLYVHGGGWVTGSLDSYDAFCRALARRSSSAVLALDYRLAPAARYPRQVDEVEAALRWALAGGVEAPVALAGDSAGGYLVARCALRAREAGLPVRAQALLYPAVDPALDTVSARENGSGFRLETETMRWYWGHFLPADAAPPSLLAAKLAGLPESLVLTAGFDPLRDEGAAFAAALDAAGVAVTRLDYPGQIHGFLRLRGQIKQGGEALDRVGRFLRGSLERRA